VLTEFTPFESLESFDLMEFSLVKNGEEVQKGVPTHMIFSLEELLSYIASNLGLGKGDIVYTGTPEGVGPLQDGDVLEMKAELSGSQKNYGPLNVTFV